MIASQRNTALADLAALVRQDPDLAATLVEAGGLRARSAAGTTGGTAPGSCRGRRRSAEFCGEFEQFLDHYLNITFDDESLDDRPDLALQVVLEMARGSETKPVAAAAAAVVLEEKLLEAVGPERGGRCPRCPADRPAELAAPGRRQHPDGSPEEPAAARPGAGARTARQAGRLDADVAVSPATAAAIVRALREPDGGTVTLPSAAARASRPGADRQPASPRAS